MREARDVGHAMRRRRRENITSHGRIGETRADEAGEGRIVPRTTAHYHGHFTVGRRRRAHDTAGHRPDVPGID